LVVVGGVQVRLFFVQLRVIRESPMIQLPVERVITYGNSTGDIPCALDDYLTMADAIEIAEGKKSIWLVGYMIYDDVFDRECTQRFLYKLDRTEGTFIRYYDKSTYRKA
jgi:hypothetical protein